MKPAFYGLQQENSYFFHVPAIQQFNFSKGENTRKQRRNAACGAGTSSKSPLHPGITAGAEHPLPDRSTLVLHLPRRNGSTRQEASNHQGSDATSKQKWPNFQRSWAPAAIVQFSLIYHCQLQFMGLNSVASPFMTLQER